ncbi:probable glucosamine 6-phosphate N-acetyltransferase isoform X2 [Sitophilus oryzae]|uniref:Glucosamine 6-phosphate N-acetyltransferase n=1 Tax=Sitophilus oryzae TaxID=7048 RepID=A0A6J2YHD1_SITOR|nr:probable glucosamine 6-phosphate N-acetyltransferase isoform X2 [Sitophilus oryzae]
MEKVTNVAPESVFLYNPDILNGLDWNAVKNKLSPFITNENPGEDYFLVRPLMIDDYDKGYLQLLSQLTVVGNVSKSDFETQFRKMKETGGYFVTVVEDIRHNKIIGSATLITELKFIHQSGLRGRLEDVVVNNTYRGKQLGKLVVLTVTLLAKKLGSYKMSLDCKDQLIPFYQSLGYNLEQGNSNSMMLRYESKL